MEDNSVNLEYIENIGTNLENLTELTPQSTIQCDFDNIIHPPTSMQYIINNDIKLENVLNNFLTDFNSPYSTLNINSMQIDYFNKMAYTNIFPQLRINEKFLLKELIHGGVFLQNPHNKKVFISSNNQLNHQCPIVDSTLYRLICLCKHLTPFISLQLTDQIQLLKYGLIEMLSVIAIQNYNTELKAWSFIDVNLFFLIELAKLN